MHHLRRQSTFTPHLRMGRPGAPSEICSRSLVPTWTWRYNQESSSAPQTRKGRREVVQGPAPMTGPDRKEPQHPKLLLVFPKKQRKTSGKNSVFLSFRQTFSQSYLLLPSANKKQFKKLLIKKTPKKQKRKPEPKAFK